LKNNTKWLFKYAPFNLNTIKILLNNELWFGKPDMQNDPNEAEFILTYNDKDYNCLDFKIKIQENLNNLIKNTDSGRKNPTGFERKEFEEELKKVVRDYLGICSMSTVCDDIQMWAHYADNNEGICLVFDKKNLINSIRAYKDKVTYSPTIAKAKFVKEGNTGHLITDKEFYMDKLKNWKDESEYRFIRRYNDRIPQNSINRLESFREKAIVGIILGERFKHENFKTIINLALLKNFQKTFYFWRSAKNLNKNTMDIIPITDKYVNFHTPLKGYEFEHILYETKRQII
jgi:hypothetical protein